MTHTEWMLLSLGSQQHLPGVFTDLKSTRLRSNRRTADRHKPAKPAVSAALFSVGGAGLQAGPGVHAPACVSSAPHC